MSGEDLWVLLPAGQRRSGEWIDDTLRARTAELGGLRAPDAGQFPRQRVEVFRGPNAAAAVDEAFRRRGWTDGLPVVAPTTGRVEAAVRVGGRTPGEVLGELDPLKGVATVEKVAVNAVMAGSAPEHLPVVLAAVEAILDPSFNLRGVQTTDENVAPLLIVNGPITAAIDLNGGMGVLGPGWRANACIGRAVRLVMHNLGGGWPGAVSFAGAGQPGRYGLCIAEDDPTWPWPPLRVELGFGADESIVVVTRAESAVNVTGGLAELASVIGSATSLFGVIHDAHAAVLISPHVARALADDGWSRRDVAQWLHDHGRLPAAMWRDSWIAAHMDPWPRRVRDHLDTGLIPVLTDAEHLLVVVAGADIPISQHVWFPPWGHPECRVVRRVGVG